jgi:predicted ferric reductase
MLTSSCLENDNNNQLFILFHNLIEKYNLVHKKRQLNIKTAQKPLAEQSGDFGSFIL